jgi:hypothetical protein
MHGGRRIGRLRARYLTRATQDRPLRRGLANAARDGDHPRGGCSSALGRLQTHHELTLGLDLIDLFAVELQLADPLSRVCDDLLQLPFGVSVAVLQELQE